MKLRNAHLLLVAFFVVTTVGCSDFPMGAGQFEESPNGRYKAEAYYYYDGKREWLELQVTDTSSGEVIWRRNNGDQKANDPPFDQGFGFLDLIQWSEDSTEVRFAYEMFRVETVTKWLAVTINSEGVRSEIRRCRVPLPSE